MSFIEFEHKYTTDDSFDRAAFLKGVATLKPIKQTELTVTDTYFVPQKQPNFIFRHRHDSEIQQLSVKSLEQDSEKRLEINLNLVNQSTQLEASRAFLDTFGIKKEFQLTKNIHVSYFSDCEIVHYVARTPRKSISCVEFEALNFVDEHSAQQTLSYYEKKLGYHSELRCRESLFELLFKDEF